MRWDAFHTFRYAADDIIKMDRFGWISRPPWVVDNMLGLYVHLLDDPFRLGLLIACDNSARIGILPIIQFLYIIEHRGP